MASSWWFNIPCLWKIIWGYYSWPPAFHGEVHYFALTSLTSWMRSVPLETSMPGWMHWLSRSGVPCSGDNRFNLIPASRLLMDENCKLQQPYYDQHCHAFAFLKTSYTKRNATLDRFHVAERHRTFRHPKTKQDKPQQPSPRTTSKYPTKSIPNQAPKRQGNHNATKFKFNNI